MGICAVHFLINPTDYNNTYRKGSILYLRVFFILCAVGALDEDIAAFGAVGGDGGLDFFYIVEKRATLPKLFVK